MDYSRKIILIAENVRISTPIKHALNKQGLEIESEYLNLHSIPAMKKGMARTGRTTFIRNELLRFIKERGFPHAIIMDGQVDLGLDQQNDPGMIKLLKTLIISYVILGKGKEYANLRGNFLLLTRGKSFEDRYGIGADPQRVLEHLMTENETINSYVDELKRDRKRFEKLFFIRLLDAELPSNNITDSVETFLKGAAVRHDPEGGMQEPATAGGTDMTPASIVFKIDDRTVYVDGSPADASAEEFADLKENEFYIMGSWVSTTELEVTKKIARTIQKGLGDRKRFNFNEEIVFNIDERSVIDKNTALSMAQLFMKNLAPYKKITIALSDAHEKVIVKSRGYPMIKERIASKEIQAEG